MAVQSIVGQFLVGQMKVGQQSIAAADVATVRLVMVPSGYEQTFSYVPIYSLVWRQTPRFGPF